MNSDLLQGFYLGKLRVDPARGLVTGPAGSEHLPPKAMEVLLVLASSAGTLVTREALLEEVWGAGHGSQEALSHAIGAIRHALADHADNPTYIQTLPKRGYRLLIRAEPLTARAAPVIPGSDAIGNAGLLENLKQRGVVEAVIAYLVVGWLIIQVADIVFDQLLLPTWAGTFVTVLVIAGLPIAIALSWYLEFRDGQAVLHTLSPHDAHRRRFSRTYMSVIGGLALAAAFVYVYDRNVGLPETQRTQAGNVDRDIVLPPVYDNTIAVLPFLNLDGSEDTQVFSNGLAEDIITRLSRVPGLLVSSRGDSFTLPPNSASQKVRERLRVALYLEGSVQITDNALRVIVQMIDSATGFHLLSRDFDRPRDDFFDIRNEITELTVANIRVALPADTQAVFGVTTEDPSLDAYVLYRRGVDASHMPTSKESVESALAWFDAALEVDGDYAAAHAGKCEVFVAAYPETDDPVYIEQAQAACARALELNPNLDVVHTALGELYHATGRYTEAGQRYLKALAINPNSVAALTGIGTSYMLQMQPEEAENYFRRAVGLHPGDWSAYNSLGRFLFHSGRYAEAAREYGRVVALDSGSMFGYSNLGTAYLLGGDFQSAAVAMERAIALAPGANTYSNLGLVHYYMGHPGKAIEMHRKAVELAPRDHLNWSNLADALWAAGDKQQARKAFARAEELVASALAVNPNDANSQMDLAWVSAMLGKNEAALSLIQRAREQSPDDPHVHYINALILLRGGDSDGALAALQRAADKGYSLHLLAAEPQLASLRADSRFRAVATGTLPP